MDRYILIHGSWHGAWCWDKVVPLLNEQGHQVEVIELAGHGQDTTSAEEISLSTYVDQVAKVLGDVDSPSILVGHSFGGIVISQFAEMFPKKVKRMVFLCAFMPRDQESLAALAAQDAESLILPNLVPSMDGTTLTIKDEVLEEVFYEDCSEEDVKWAIDRLVPEPAAPIGTPVSLTDGNYGQVDRVYIETLRDRAISHPFQKTMVENNPCEVLTLPTSHSPFISAPDELAEHLLKLG